MSGGSYEYAYRHVEDFADCLDESGLCDAALPEMRRAFAEHCKLVAKAMKACEWNDSCDGDSDEAELIAAVLSDDAALRAAKAYGLEQETRALNAERALEQAQDEIAALRDMVAELRKSQEPLNTLREAERLLQSVGVGLTLVSAYKERGAS